MRGLPHLLGVVFLATAVGGCSLLDLLGGPFPLDPENPFPSPEATFTTGRATIELDDETIVLDRLVGEGSISTDLGIDATWTNGEGWYLSFYGYPEDGGSIIPDAGFVALDRIVDTRHWILYNPERCVTTTDQADPDGLAGIATCRDVEWADYFSAYSPSGVPVKIPGEPPFDAEITFEAR